jgi:hypothetical protein
MAIFNKIMFLPRKTEVQIEEIVPKEHTNNKGIITIKKNKKIELEECTNEHTNNKGSITIKEIVIVSFLYLLMASSVGTLILYLIMNFQQHPNAKDVLDIFKYVFSTLVGYFLGTNKER